MNHSQAPMMPMARSLASQGRLNDSMLVHMNPREVAGLQSLARQNGTSLTINPQTGLPEAFGLRNILPMVAGAALTPVLGPGGAALAVGGLGALATGSLGQGLMMGLGAYGGAGLAGSAANLAAPAADVTAASGADFAAQQAASNAAAQQAAVQQAASLPDAMGAPIDMSGNVLGIDESAVQTVTGANLTQPASIQTSGLNNFFTPDRSATYENIGAGFKQAFSSPSALMDFAGNNKMNLAMSAAPTLMPEETNLPQGRRFTPRTYDLDIENVSGSTPIDPAGRESRRIGYTFTPTNVEGLPSSEEKKIKYAEGGATGASPAIGNTAIYDTAPSQRASASDIAFYNSQAGQPAPAAPATSGLTAIAPTAAGFAPSEPAPVRFSEADAAQYDVSKAFGIGKLQDLLNRGATRDQIVDIGRRAPVVGTKVQQLFPEFQPNAQMMGQFATYDPGENFGMAKYQQMAAMGATPYQIQQTAQKASTIGTRANELINQQYSPFAQAGGRVSPEQMVMSDIASVQGLAGLPTSARILPRETQFRYDLSAAAPLAPVTSGAVTSGGEAKGLKDLDKIRSETEEGELEARSPKFFRKEGYREAFNKKDYKEFKPDNSVDMSQYEWNPTLGGYVEKRPVEHAKTGGAIRNNKVQAPTLENGGFVLTKKAVDGLGSGSNKKGQKVASRGLGAIPIKGPGTGTSDSIKTSIEGKRPALVSNGEAYVPKKQVAKHGGAKKFYALMKKAERRA